MVGNSSDLLVVLRQLSTGAGDNVQIDIQWLAMETGVPLSKLISMLTELEHRDYVMLSIETIPSNGDAELSYSGFVRTMEMPPDEE